MKSLLVCFIYFSGALTAFSQDSLLFSNHYSLSSEIVKCRESNNQLECLNNLIKLTEKWVHSKKGAKAEIIKQKKALFIYYINAGCINQMRGNYTEFRMQLDQAEKYMDSLKGRDAFDKDLEQINLRLKFIQREWCYHHYEPDSAAFYACDCAKFFPELNASTIESNIDSTAPNVTEAVPKAVIPERDTLFGKLVVNDTLRLAPQFVLDSNSTEYFQTYQSYIFSELSKIRSSEVLAEVLSAKDTGDNDTVIIHVQIEASTIEMSKKCSVVYSADNPLVAQFLMSEIMKFDFPYAHHSVSFYIPFVIQRIESDARHNLGRFTLGSDHFFIQCERIKPIRLH